MLLLTAVTDKISLITDDACDVDVVAIYTERNQSTGAVGATARQVTHPTTATTTDIVDVPGATTDRNIREIIVRNAHATTSVDVTVQFDANGVLYELFAARLYPKEALEYTLDRGFTKLSRSKMPTFYGIDSYTSLFNNQVANISLVPGCSFKIPPSTTTRQIGVFAACVYLSLTTTVGFQPIIASLGAAGAYGRTTGICTAVNGVLAATLMCQSGTAGQQITNGTTPLGETFGVVAGGFEIPITLEGGVRDFILGFLSETAATNVAVQAGTWFEVFEDTEQ